MRQRSSRQFVLAILSVSALVWPGLSVASNATNDTTGANSDNQASINHDVSFSVSVDNTADIDNRIDLSLQTGSNSASANTGDGTVVSGDVDAAIITENEANGDVTVAVPLPGGLFSAEVSNRNTGANSANNASVEVSHTVDIATQHTATINNATDLSIKTGKNEADNNTGDGSVKSGDVRVRLSLDNQANVPRATPSPTPPPTGGNGGGGNGGGGTVTPSPSPTPDDGVGGGVTPTASPIPTVSPTPDRVTFLEALGMGGGGAPRITAVQPREGIGGAFFPAGGSWLPLLVGLIASSLIASLRSYLKAGRTIIT